MLYLVSLVNLMKNVVVKLWSYKIVRFAVYGYLFYYFGYGMYEKISARLGTTVIEWQGWEAVMPNFQLGYNPSFTKSGKANFGIMNAISRLGSVFVPGLLGVAIILYLQKVFNTFKAPPLPILYSGNDADELIVEDYRLPVLYTPGEAEEEYDEDELEEED